MARKEPEWYAGAIDRDRGILNERERRYLLNNGARSNKVELSEEYQVLESDQIEPGSAQERQVRQQIRDHTMNAILDFSLLMPQLEDRDKRRVFNDGYDPEKMSEMNNQGTEGRIDEVQREIPIVIGFLYQLYQLEYRDGASQALENAVKRAIETVHNTDGRKVTATVNIEIEFGSEIDEIVNRYDSKGMEAIDGEEAHMLFQRGEMATEEYLRYVEEYEQ